MKKSASFILNTILLLLLFVATVCLCSTLWMLRTWADLSMDEIVFHLKSSLSGTNPAMIYDYLIRCGLIEIIIPILFVLLFVFFRKHDRRIRVVRISGAVLSFVFLLSAGISLERRLDVSAYVVRQNTISDFVEENYADPSEVDILFPEKKRNLVYIYLESMEVTYADEGSGGAFTDNYIPELTGLAEQGEDFSGSDARLNGGVSLVGTTWTTGAMFAQSSGLPLLISVGGNNMDTQNSFFPNVITVGDILEENGYRNVLMLGSQKEFGGREGLYSEHGNYEILDYSYMKETGNIPEDYYVFWGYEDQKLFEFAKKELLELSVSGQPFNLTLLTVDTHFEDGYICDLCEDAYPDQYANVIACSSRQVSDFVRWIQEQNFYPDTTIIISGDHPTMDSDFCASVDSSYTRRVFTTYLNADAAVAKGTGRRAYSTFDHFPTTLAALGCEIDQDRLGLGVNLFSGVQTLVEQYGIDLCNEELGKKSELLEDLLSVEMTEALKKRIAGTARLQADYADGRLDYCFRIDPEYAAEGILSDIQAEVTIGDKTELISLSSPEQNGEYRPEEPLEVPAGSRLQIRITGKAYDEGMLFIKRTYRNTSLLRGSAVDYLDQFVDNDDVIVFLAVRRDALYSINEELRAKLQEFGLSDLQADTVGRSYLAIIDEEVVVEQAAYEALEVNGAFEEYDLKYTVVSQGKGFGSHSSVLINEKEYSPKKRGFNIVVYDKAEKRVVSTAYINTEEGDFGIMR